MNIVLQSNSLLSVHLIVVEEEQKKKRSEWGASIL